MRRKIILGGITISLIAATVYIGPIALQRYIDSKAQIYLKQQSESEQRVPDKEVWMKERRNQEDFEARIQAELEKEWYKKSIDDSTKALKQLEDKGFNGEKVSQLQRYLRKYNPVLTAYAAEIAELPRYSEVVAIATAETNLCTKGVGESKNNCGAIKGGREGFKNYTHPMDALEDISILLAKPQFKGKSIDEMNGVYCVNEVAGSGPCPEWDDNVKHYMTELLTS